MQSKVLWCLPFTRSREQPVTRVRHLAPGDFDMRLINTRRLFISPCPLLGVCEGTVKTLGGYLHVDTYLGK